MPTLQYRYIFRASAWRLGLVLALSWPGLALRPAMATATYPQLQYPKQPDQMQLKAYAVQQIAAALDRPCSSQAAVVWNSVKPADDLRTLAGDMMGNLPAFENLTEVADFTGRPATGGQRLYTGKLRDTSFAYTFLWIAGQDNVTLQICSDQPVALTTKQKFPQCVTTTGPITTPLGICPPSSAM
ncbi:hypothetical protein AKG95_13335 [Janthinobacterium lividum]|uniref:Uncharacterized protein n=1 Tax=Janthinobacterium lividum TaxID=29581 RepID=A0A1S1U601_9BURK|nr:hypothetical protein [Janthinobacterium lividum]OHV95875.1 hypothetical protein AKG95_13335 [Janthinobacterium lividum]